jgi:hypothetical protein
MPDQADILEVAQELAAIASECGDETAALRIMEIVERLMVAAGLPPETVPPATRH